VLLAEPIVRLLLGAQWTAVPPLVQLMALAAMFSFPLVLAFPMFVALGRIKDAFLANLISLPISALVLFGGASISLEAAAASLILTVPLQAIITLVLLRRVMPFRWGELARAVTRSAAVGLCAAMPPALAVVMSGSGFALSTPVFLVAGLAAGLCWLGALWGLGHPLMSEVFHLGRAVAGARAARRAHARGGTA
jgi:O-antigen/teichoic acid export membrane protein